MYEPRFGRWTSPDPDHQFWSPYLGMGNNPTYCIDKDGRWIHIALGAAIGGVAAGVKLAIAGKFDITSLNTWEHIGVGMGTGALIAAVPMTIFGAVEAGVIGGIGTIADQAIDLNSRGKDLSRLSNYNLTEAGVDGALGAISFGAGGIMGNALRKSAIMKNWTGPLNRSFFTKQFYDHPSLSGLTGGATADIAATALKYSGAALFGNLFRSAPSNVIMLPEITVNATRDAMGAVRMTTESQQEVWDSLEDFFTP